MDLSQINCALLSVRALWPVRVLLSVAGIFLLVIVTIFTLSAPPALALDESLFPPKESFASQSEPAPQQEDFLRPEQAFQIQGKSEGNTLRFRFTIAPDYYLYKHRFEFMPTDSKVKLGEPTFSKVGKDKQDPTFGRVEAFYDEVDVTVPVVETPDGFVEVKVQYQGCAEKGLCYLPQYHTEMFQVEPGASGPGSGDAAATTSADSPSLKPTSAEKYPRPFAANDTDTASGIEQLLASSSLLKITLLFFGFGLALSLTPCVLPMVPILTSLIVGQGQRVTPRRGFLLSSSYVAGMAITYTLAGVAAGASGATIQYWLQDPAVLVGTALLFVLLSLSMFGFYELQLPAFLHDRLHRAHSAQRGGSFVGVAIMGAISAIVVSPCISAPLMGALLYIGKSGDAMLGGYALFALSLGMGTPLIALGTTEANILPKAGQWMENVKGLFGVILLGVGLWITQHLLPEGIDKVLWGILGILAALYLGAAEHIPHAKGKFFRGIGLGIGALGTGMILAGSLQLSGLPLRGPQVEASTSLPFVTVRTESALDLALEEAAKNGKPVMVDVWEDWCIACKEMEHQVLSRPDVAAELAAFQLIKLDLTDTPDGTQLLKRFRIPGPPAYLFFTPDGGELRSFHLVGSMSAPSFLRHLQSLPME